MRKSAHALLGPGHFPTLADWRQRTRSGEGPWARRVRVFAVEPTAVQIDWAVLGPGPIEFRGADTHRVVTATGGPGAITLEGLPAGRTTKISITGEGVPRGRDGSGAIELSVTTPHPPPGEEIARIATVSDLHVGETTFGFLHTIGEPVSTPDQDGHSLRAARAAIAESAAWGAQRLICKGDIVDQSHPGHWNAIIDVLEQASVPVHLIAGNHEVKRRRSIEPAEALATSSITYTDRIDAVDLGGASVVLVNSTIPDRERGQLDPVADDLIELLRTASGGSLVALHHHLRAGQAVGSWPVGVPGDESNRVLERMAAVHPATMVTSGHVHRNRLRRHGPIVCTCVGSAKDYPGVWAGYVFHEGGMRQVIRRIAEPSVISWTERTGDALVGMYRYWTPSTLAKRCVSVNWTAS